MNGIYTCGEFQTYVAEEGYPFWIDLRKTGAGPKQELRFNHTEVRDLIHLSKRPLTGLLEFQVGYFIAKPSDHGFYLEHGTPEGKIFISELEIADFQYIVKYIAMEISENTRRCRNDKAARELGFGPV